MYVFEVKESISKVWKNTTFRVFFFCLFFVFVCLFVCFFWKLFVLREIKPRWRFRLAVAAIWVKHKLHFHWFSVEFDEKGVKMLRATFSFIYEILKLGITKIAAIYLDKFPFFMKKYPKLFIFSFILMVIYIRC